MMKPSSPILILSPRQSEDSQALWRAALHAGWHIERAIGWNPPVIANGREVVVYGEPILSRRLAEAYKLNLLEPPANWLVQVEYEWTKRKIRSGELREFLIRTEPLFLKPPDDKLFPAKVYAPADVIPASDFLPPDTPVIASEPVKWQVEYRCFVINGKVETYSPYWRDGQLAQSTDGEWTSLEGEQEEIIKFAENLMQTSKARLPEALVLDVGKIEGRGLAAVECNPCWASGLYGCDPNKVLEIVRKACVPQT